MAGLVFYFEENDVDVWSGRNIDLDSWNYNCKIGLINDVIIINKTNQSLIPFDVDMNINIVSELPELNGNVTQLVTQTDINNYGLNSTDLWDFDHNTDWYVIGPANGWGGNYFGSQFLTIPQNNLCHHHSVFVASTVMYHRYYKIKNI